jgi:hypothetical protein
MNASPMVVDLSPFPHGKGFQGAQEWWDYVLSKDERKRVDQLLGIALLDQTVCYRLVKERDETLLNAFGLSESTKQWFRGVNAQTLSDLAQAVLDTFQGAA